MKLLPILLAEYLFSLHTSLCEGERYIAVLHSYMPAHTDTHARIRLSPATLLEPEPSPSVDVASGQTAQLAR